MDFIYLFRVLMKKKWIILGAALIAATIAFFFTRNQQRKYKAFAQMSTGFTQSEEIRMNPTNDNTGYNEADINFNNVMITAESPTVIGLLSYTLILHDLQSPTPFRYVSEKDRKSALYQSIDKSEAIRVFANSLEDMSPLNSYRPEDRRLLELLDMYHYDYKDLISNLSVYRLQRTDYVQIEYLSENPELSAYVVNTLYEQFIRYYRTVRSTRSIESIDTLKSLLDRKKQVLDEKNDQLRQQGIINVGQENGAKFEMILNQQQLLSEQETKQTADNFALKQVNSQLAAMGVSATPGKSNAGSVTNDELLKTRDAMKDAYSQYLNSGATDENLRKRYESLKTEYNQKVAAALNSSGGTASGAPASPEDKSRLLDKQASLEVSLKAEEATIGAIQNKIASLQSNLTADASKAAALQSLIREADLANKEYLDAKQRYNEANDIMASSVNSFRLFLMGQPPLEPESSKRILIVGLAGVFVLV